MEYSQFVNFFSLDQSVKLPCNYRNSKQKIYKIREAIRTAHSIKSMHKTQSQPIFPQFASKMVMANIPSSSEKTPNLKKTRHKYKLNQQDNIIKNQDTSILLQKYFKRNKYNLHINNKAMYYPVLKSPYQLIEDLRGVVVNISQYKSNGPMIHEVRAEYLIDKINKEEKRKIERLVKSKNAICPLDEEEEMYDAFLIEDPGDVEIKKSIKKFLMAKDSKLNQIIMGKDDFFESKENKINFSFDIYNVPHIKNILRSYPLTKDNQMKYFNIKNTLSPDINRYLYIRRLKLQKEKDEKEVLIKAGLIDQNEKDNPQMLKALSNLEIKQYEKETMMPKTNIAIFDLEDFFINKYMRYEHTQFASELNKDFILNKFHDLSFQKYYKFHTPKIISKLS